MESHVQQQSADKCYAHDTARGTCPAARATCIHDEICLSRCPLSDTSQSVELRSATIVDVHS